MRALSTLVFFLLPSFVMATPALTSKSGSDDDARISLTVERETIRGDTRSYCQINIRVTESRVEFSRNDKIFLYLKESDPLVLDDDTVWSRVITVQGRGSINQTFDCSKKANGDDNPFPGDDGVFDDGNTLNLYAEARVEKDDCGLLCRNDRPSTGTIDLRIRTDDGAEQTDDMLGDNNPRLPPGLTTGRISRDADWYRIDVGVRSRLTYQALYRVGYGNIDLALFDAQERQLAVGFDNRSGSVLTSDPLSIGTYYVKAIPRNGRAYNFYDINFSLQGEPGECQPGAAPEEQPCGNCGTQQRTCGQDQTWGAWGECTNQGVCRPGITRDVACGNRCGTQTDTCNVQCEWSVGACENEGQCVPGSSEEQVCNDGDQQGEQRRVCDDNCQYGDFGPCQFCAPGQPEVCFDGPLELCDLDMESCEGLCQTGVRQCVNGAWGACVGQRLPTNGENKLLCNDGLDNDCDGLTDGEDSDCWACGNNVLEPGEECDDGANDCNPDCVVQATDVSAGGDFPGAFEGKSFDLFVFALDAEQRVRLSTADNMGNCPFDQLGILAGANGEIERDDDDGCIVIERVLAAGNYTVKITADANIDVYTFTAQFGDDEAPMGGVAAVGGMPAVSGMPAVGGKPAPGGMAAAGGMPVAGGTASVGGMASAGGAATAGGMAAEGGMAAAGGMTATAGGAPLAGQQVQTGGTVTLTGGVPTSPMAGQTTQPSAGQATTPITPLVGGTGTTPSTPSAPSSGGASGGGAMGAVGSSSAEGCDCNATDSNPLTPAGLVLAVLLLGLRRRRR